MQFSNYIAPVGKLCAVSGHCLPDYMDWFYMILHPFMSLAQPGDPPRVPSVQQYNTFVEPDVYQQSMAVAAPDEAVDVHHLRHAVIIYFFGICVCCFLLFFITNNCYVFFFTC